MHGGGGAGQVQLAGIMLHVVCAVIWVKSSLPDIFRQAHVHAHFPSLLHASGLPQGRSRSSTHMPSILRVSMCGGGAVAAVIAGAPGGGAQQAGYAL
jgi:hypothetical protein